MFVQDGVCDGVIEENPEDCEGVILEKLDVWLGSILDQTKTFPTSAVPATPVTDTELLTLEVMEPTDAVD